MEGTKQPQADVDEKPDSLSKPSPELHGIQKAPSSNMSKVTTSDPLSREEDRAKSTASPMKPSMLKRAWTKLGFNSFVFMFMVKGALSPTISLAIYQSHSVASNYLNLGYVMIVISILSVPILPRGKYLMNLLISLVLTCFGAAMVLFGQWLSIKARQATTPANASLAVANGYNSSAAAVNAIFMIINIFGINVLRAARPIFSIPAIEYTIIIVIGFSYGPLEPTETHSIKFVKELLYAFLTGQGVATGVSLFIIPVSSRRVFFGEATGFLHSARGLLKAQLAFVEALEYSEMCEPSVPNSVSESEGGAEAQDPVTGDTRAAQKKLLYKQRASDLKVASAGLLALGGKLRDDVVFARREIAWGKLGSADIHDLHLLLRNIMLPISGISTISDISERLRGRYRSDRRKFEETQCPETRSTEFSEKDQESEQAEWRELIREIHGSFEPVIQVLDEGVLHVLILLNLVPKAAAGGKSTSGESAQNKTAALGDDVEKGSKHPEPGDIGFGDFLDKEIQEFRKQRTSRLQEWTRKRGLDSVFHTPISPMSEKHVQFSSPPSSGNHNGYMSLKKLREARASQRLHLILYMEYLLYSVAKATLALVRFAESKVNDGSFLKSRLIVPPAKTLLKWIKGILREADSSPNIEMIDQMAGNVETVRLGDSLRVPKDPEHLPPKNARQAFEDRLRVVPKALRSDSVKFGVRVTIAVMSIGILAFLHDTHKFYISQRVIWALVMIAIGMNPSSGSAVFNLLGNLATTLIGMVLAYINWYMVDQKTPGVIVFFFLFQALYFYFAGRYPRFLVAIAAGAIAHVLIIGYELQVRVIGLKVATATGQPYYPTYKIAPFRLLTVAGGVTVAFIWTIFPVPITEGSLLRRDLGNSLFLLAKYLNSVTSTVDQRVKDKEGDMSLESSPGRKLARMRHKVLQKQLALLNSMRQNIAFMAWEPHFGGDFPKESYQLIINEVQSMANYLSVISYASEAFPAARLQSTSSTTWLNEFSQSRSESSAKSHEVTTLLSLLSASLLNKQPLPPYLQVPSPFHLYKQLSGPELGILNFTHINEPGYRAFAVIEIAHVCMVDSVGRILTCVRDVVGEVDFSYSFVSPSAGNSESVLEGVEGKQKAQ